MHMAHGLFYGIAVLMEMDASSNPTQAPKDGARMGHPGFTYRKIAHDGKQ